MAQQEKLTLDNLRKVGFGIVNEAFDRELKRLTQDCEDRPMDDKPRSLTLTAKLTPKADTTGRDVVCDGVQLEFEVSSKVPVRRTRIFNMKPKQDGSLFFHPDLPEDAEGDALYDDDVRRREGAKA